MHEVSSTLCIEILSHITLVILFKPCKQIWTQLPYNSLLCEKCITSEIMRYFLGHKR